MSEARDELEGFGDPLEAKAWIAGPPAYAPLDRVFSRWIVETRAARGPELRARLDALGVCLKTCARAATFWEAQRGGPSTAASKGLPPAQEVGQLADACAAITRTLTREGDELGATDALGAFGPKIVDLLRTMSARASLLNLKIPPHAATQNPEPAAETSLAAYARMSLALHPATQHRPELRSLHAAHFRRVFTALALSRPGRWVDIGSGDARSLSGVAALAAAREFVGIDVAWSYTLRTLDRLRAQDLCLPENTRYLVLGEASAGPDFGELEFEHVRVSPEERRWPDRLAARTVATLGAHTADVASLFYPIHMEQTGSDLQPRSAVEFQLATAVKLLAPGGTGVVVTEDMGAWRATMRALIRNPAVESLIYVADAVGAQELRSVGVHPYSTTMGELDPTLADPDQISAAGPEFCWGLVIMFTTRTS